MTARCRFARGLVVAMAGAALLSGRAAAQGGPIYGDWTGTALVNGRHVPARYTFTASHTITRETGEPPSIVVFSGNYELTGEDMRITWTAWSPRWAKPSSGPSTENCTFEWEGPNVFDCGDERFERATE